MQKNCFTNVYRSFQGFSSKVENDFESEDLRMTFNGIGSWFQEDEIKDKYDELVAKAEKNIKKQK